MKRAFSNGALAAAIALTSAVAAFAQSDTAEVRPSDLKAAPANASGEDFRERKEEVRANIELWQSRVRKKSEQIDKVLKGHDLRKIAGQKVAIAAIDELLQTVDDEAKGIIEAHTRIGPDLKLYRQALLKAPEVFSKIAETMDSRAPETKSTGLKEAYADMAIEARKLAIAYQTKAKGIDSLESDIARKMQFVAESRVFIADVRELLAAIPTEEELKIEKLVERLNQYLLGFDEAIKAIKGVAGKIGAEAQPTTPSASPAKSKPLSWRLRPSMVPAPPHLWPSAHAESMLVS